MLKLIRLACLAVLLAPAPSQAQSLVESYVARLSPQDHFNSNGQRLTSAAAIIRQDRANFHRFGVRDPEDEPDRFFANGESRAALEAMLQRGSSAQAAINAVVNGTPLVRVNIYRGARGQAISVEIIGD